jgi:hypothetical protein
MCYEELSQKYDNYVHHTLLWKDRNLCKLSDGSPTSPCCFVRVSVESGVLFKFMCFVQASMP